MGKMMKPRKSVETDDAIASVVILVVAKRAIKTIAVSPPVAIT